MKLIHKFTSLYSESPLQGKVFYLLITLGFLASIISSTANIILDLGLPLVISTLLTALFCIIMFIVTVKTGSYVGSAYFTFWILILFIYPSVWIFNAGSHGPTPGMYVFNTVLMSIIFEKTKMRKLILTKILSILSLLFIELNFPQFITTYSNENTHIIDIFIGTTITILFTYMILNRLMIEYNKRIHEQLLIESKLHHQTITDELTGIYNRRHIMNEITSCLEDENYPELTLLMMDIDNFKNINDLFGHTFGDEVIIGVAKSLQHNIRSKDVVARIGGEEYLILFKSLSIDDARIRAEHIRKSISEISWSVDGLVVTLSGGLYERTLNDTLDTVLEKVDVNLYEAKSNGKNMIV